MDRKTFCTTFSAELAGWRARMYDIIGHVETLPPLDRQHVAPDVNTLRALISEIDDSLSELKTECLAEADVCALPAPVRQGS